MAMDVKGQRSSFRIVYAQTHTHRAHKCMGSEFRECWFSVLKRTHRENTVEQEKVSERGRDEVEREREREIRTRIYQVCQKKTDHHASLTGASGQFNLIRCEADMRDSLKDSSAAATSKDSRQIENDMKGHKYIYIYF